MKLLKKLALGIASLIAAATCSVAEFPYQLSQGSFPDTYSAEYTDFNWNWSDAADQKVYAVFANSGYSNVALKLVYPAYGNSYLEAHNGTATNLTNSTSYGLIVAASNVPPPNQYFGEFLGFNETNGLRRILARGKITTKWSVWSVTNSASWSPRVITVNYVPATETDPIAYPLASNAWWKADDSSQLAGDAINAVASTGTYLSALMIGATQSLGTAAFASTGSFATVYALAYTSNGLASAVDGATNALGSAAWMHSSNFVNLSTSGTAVFKNPDYSTFGSRGFYVDGDTFAPTVSLHWLGYENYYGHAWLFADPVWSGDKALYYVTQDEGVDPVTNRVAMLSSTVAEATHANSADSATSVPLSGVSGAGTLAASNSVLLANVANAGTAAGSNAAAFVLSSGGRATNTTLTGATFADPASGCVPMFIRLWVTSDADQYNIANPSTNVLGPAIGTLAGLGGYWYPSICKTGYVRAINFAADTGIVCRVWIQTREPTVGPNDTTTNIYSLSRTATTIGSCQYWTNGLAVPFGSNTQLRVLLEVTTNAPAGGYSLSVPATVRCDVWQ